jgi:hypothetical protein
MGGTSWGRGHAFTQKLYTFLDTLLILVQLNECLVQPLVQPNLDNTVPQTPHDCQLVGKTFSGDIGGIS